MHFSSCKLSINRFVTRRGLSQPTSAGSGKKQSGESNRNQGGEYASTGKSNRTHNTMNGSNPTGNDSEDLLQILRDNSAPLGSNVRVMGSPKPASSGPRQAIMIIHILHRANGIHGYAYGFRRLEEPDKGTYMEKIHRDQVRASDPYLLGPPLNILRATYGAYKDGLPLLNDKGYELSVFIALQNFENKNEQKVRQLAKFFGMAIKQHVEHDPTCQNQEIVVTDDNIHYNRDSVFMDLIGEKNAVNLYRTVLPVDSTPGYSESFVNHARSFFCEGSLTPQSVALIKGDDRFLAPLYRNETGEEGGEQAGGEEARHNGEQEEEA